MTRPLMNFFIQGIVKIGNPVIFGRLARISGLGALGFAALAPLVRAATGPLRRVEASACWSRTGTKSRCFSTLLKLARLEAPCASLGKPKGRAGQLYPRSAMLLFFSFTYS